MAYGYSQRDIDAVLRQTKDLRITCIHTISSFYVQLVEEDAVYQQLEKEMLYFYKAPALGQVSRNAEHMKKLRRQDLQPGQLIAMPLDGSHARCIVTISDYCEAQDMDTGDIYRLEESTEEKGIYALHVHYRLLPPRAILCGLAYLRPMYDAAFWTRLSCNTFKILTHGCQIRGDFTTRGLVRNSAYVRLDSTELRTNNTIDVNENLVYSQVAVSVGAGLEQPIAMYDIAGKLIRDRKKYVL